MPLDTRGDYYDGSPINDLSQLTAALMKRPEPLVRTFTENLMAYALGRRVENFDQPPIRAIARQAAADGYRMSSFILGVVKSDAFQRKRSEPPATDRRRPGRRPAIHPFPTVHVSGDTDVVHHRKAAGPTHLPPRRRRHRGPAVPGRDGPGRPRCWPRRRERTRLVCIEEVHGLAGCNDWAASKFLYAPATDRPDFRWSPTTR